MSRIYKATISPNVSGGNIEVRMSANSTYQAKELIKQLPYFKSFVRQPVLESEDNDNLNKISKLVKKANEKEQAKLAGIE